MSFKKHVILAKAYDRKGNLISASFNNYNKSHPLMAKFAKMAGQPERIYLHAEVRALLLAKDEKVHKITVERYSADGKPALAKPCKCCQVALDFFGVKEVEYTSSNGTVKEKINA